MKVIGRLGAAVGIAAAVVLATPSLASALAVTVPSSADLGTVPSGTSTLSAKLGAITVTASGLVAPSFTASVSGTTFTTGAGGVNQTIAKASILYWSGPATSVSGLLGSGTPGQATSAQAQALTTSRTAFSGTGLLLSISATWNPTIVINFPSSIVTGTYTATITHSVA
ncbi:MAG TPA: hypothetical protein VHS52_09725 [Acidimicrobiales bacterium]|jgi:hypothetical protein|nr:hypothetical protein [Acidimicrobiales bacterium]